MNKGTGKATIFFSEGEKKVETPAIVLVADTQEDCEEPPLKCLLIETEQSESDSDTNELSEKEEEEKKYVELDETMDEGDQHCSTCQCSVQQQVYSLTDFYELGSIKSDEPIMKDVETQTYLA